MNVPAHMRYMFADAFTFVGELPKELGKLVNLTDLDLSYNEKIHGELYIPSYIHTLGHAHNGVVCVCTVPEEEKMALEAKLPGCWIIYPEYDMEF